MRPPRVQRTRRWVPARRSLGRSRLRIERRPKRRVRPPATMVAHLRPKPAIQLRRPTTVQPALAGAVAAGGVSAASRCMNSSSDISPVGLVRDLSLPGGFELHPSAGRPRKVQGCTARTTTRQWPSAPQVKSTRRRCRVDASEFSGPGLTDAAASWSGPAVSTPTSAPFLLRRGRCRRTARGSLSRL